MNINRLNSAEDLLMRRRSVSERRASEDWEWQQRMCVESFQEAEHERALQTVAVGLVQSPQFQRVVRAMQIERNKQRPTAVASSGMIYRNAGQPDLRQMQANLERMKRRGAELTRQVQREHAGYR